MSELSSNFGRPITVRPDGLGDRLLDEDVALGFGADHVLLTPAKARKLARRLLKVADKVERINKGRGR